MTATQPNDGLSRRDLLRRTAVGAGTVAVVGGGATRLDHGPVQETEAIAPAVAAGGIAASAATGWVLRETEIIGSDDPPEDITDDALKNELNSVVSTRRSTNLSTVVDNKNIADQLDQAAWSKAKMAAIESINDGNTESETIDIAQEAAEDHITTVQKNFVKSWNESIEEAETYIQTAEDNGMSDEDLFIYDGDGYNMRLDEESATLANGESISVHEWHWYDGYRSEHSFLRPDSSTDEDHPTKSVHVKDIDLDYLDINKWNPVWESLKETETEVLSAVDTWVEAVYSDAQAGDIDTSQLLTATDRANMTADDEGFAQAQAELQALNIPTDIEREAEIYFPDIDTTLFGQLAYTGDEVLSTGSIDPDNKDGSIYLTYDLAQGSGLWTHYEDGLDGGVITLTSNPPPGYLFEIVTTEDETATVSSDEFNHQYNDNNETVWTYDFSDDLDDPIVDFELYVTTQNDHQYETTRLDDVFEIVSISDPDGNDYESVEFDTAEAHTDDNYITQDEWEQRQERHEELIEKYEQAQDGGGGGFLGDTDNNLILIAVAALGAFALFGGN